MGLRDLWRSYAPGDLVRCYYCGRRRAWWWPRFRIEYVSSWHEPPKPREVCRWRCIGDPGSLSAWWRSFLWRVFRVDR